MAINKVSELRSFISEQIEALVDKRIKPEEANSCAMLAANILLSIRLEIDYNKMLGEKNKIEFMEIQKGKLIEHE